MDLVVSGEFIHQTREIDYGWENPRKGKFHLKLDLWEMREVSVSHSKLGVSDINTIF